MAKITTASSTVPSVWVTKPARWPCASRERSLRISPFTFVRTDLDVTCALPEQQAIDHATGEVVEGDPLRPHRVDGLHGQAHGGLADHATEVDALHDRLDVDGAGDVVDRDLLHEPNEVELCDHVLGDLLDDDGDQRGGLRLVAGLLAPRHLVPVPQCVLHRAERTLHDRGLVRPTPDRSGAL